MRLCVLAPTKAGPVIRDICAKIHQTENKRAWVGVIIGGRALRGGPKGGTPVHKYSSLKQRTTVTPGEVTEKIRETQTFSRETNNRLKKNPVKK